MNIHGQTKIPLVKHLQIEDFIKFNKIDMLHMQETDLDEESFSSCNYISSSYNILSNNSVTKYGTATLINTEFSNMKM